jgi:hypothetical protein
MNDTIYRHRCRQADACYDDGLAMVYFDIQCATWTLVHANRRVWRAWWDDRTRPHPLWSAYGADYWVRLTISCCPWCGMRLAEDPNFLAAERQVEALLSLVKAGAVGGGVG